MMSAVVNFVFIVEYFLFFLVFKWLMSTVTLVLKPECNNWLLCKV